MNTEDEHTMDKEVTRVLTEMKKLQVESEEYTQAVKNLDTLCAARSSKTNSWLSADLIVPAVVNILGIVLVLNYEKLGVVTSKAMNMVGRK